MSFVKLCCDGAVRLFKRNVCQNYLTRFYGTARMAICENIASPCGWRLMWTPCFLFVEAYHSWRSFFLLIVRCFFGAWVSISWWSRDAYVHDDASVNVKAVDPQFSMNILSLYIFDVVARLLCLRNAKRMWAPSQDNRLREIRNLLLLKQRSVDKKASGSMYGKPFLRRTML